MAASPPSIHRYFRQAIVVMGCLMLLLMAIGAEAQTEGQPRRRGSRVIDDSTKQVYGPKTTRYYYERDIYLNKLTYHTIDTAIRNFQRLTFVQKGEYKYQDLGNIATAIRPIYYQMPEQIGATSGFTSFDMYWNAEQIRLFDTHSPYANMWVMLGGKGRSMTRATFSRNINPRWNFGFTYRALLIDKQVQRQNKGDRAVRSTYYDFFTSFLSKDSSYRVIASFRRNKYDVDEYGGVRKTQYFVDPADYYSKNAQPELLEAANEDLRMSIRIYQQYEIGRALQLYNTFERYRQGNEFTDIYSKAPKEPKDYYDYTDQDILKMSDSTQGLTKFRSIRDEVGFKGNLLKLFYQGYYAARWWNHYNLYNAYYEKGPRKGFEHYLGGRMSLRLDSLGELSGWVEVQSTGNFRIEADLKSKWFEASIKQLQYSVPFVYQQYIGMHDNWENDFNPVNVTQLNGAIHYNSRVFSISPGLTFTRLGNYVFMKLDSTNKDVKQTVLPTQASSDQVIASPEVKFELTMLRHVHLRTDIIYTKLLASSDDAIQIPDLFINAQLAYENIHFNTNLDIHTGLEFHYQTDYYALGYDVPMSLFYVQTEKPMKAFPIVDAFVSARIKKGKIFFKYNNIVQALTKQGYQPTPEYPGQRNIVDFGFDWSFYD